MSSQELINRIANQAGQDAQDLISEAWQDIVESWAASQDEAGDKAPSVTLSISVKCEGSITTPRVVTKLSVTKKSTSERKVELADPDQEELPI